MLKGYWINADAAKPPLLDGEDYSANVWGWDGKELLIVNWYVEPGEGCFWGNAYGNIWGYPEFDDDYKITHWMPIEIPEPPTK